MHPMAKELFEWETDLCLPEKDVKDGLYAAAFSSARSEQKKGEYEIFGRMNDTTRGVLRTGSAALNLPMWLVPELTAFGQRSCSFRI